MTLPARLPPPPFASPPPSAAHRPGGELGARAGAPSDYLTFLRMLTVQMQNQDPLNPMQASDFAVQLATFAGVEQATQTNQLLAALLGRSGLADLGSWVGMEARVHGGAWFDGTPLALNPDPAVGAESVTLIVRDETGAIVASHALPPGTTAFVWDGRTAEGNQLPAGRYTFELESRRGDEVIHQSPVAAYLPVREVRIENGTTYLVLPGGYLVEAAQVSGLRRPPPASEAAPPPVARLPPIW